MKTRMEQAKELFLQYGGNRFYMALNGEEHLYDGYHISKETEEMWRRAYLEQFFEQELYGREALGAYATAAGFLKHDSDEETWERFLYYPLRSARLDDVTVLFMLQISLRSAAERAKKGKLSQEEVRKYLPSLHEYAQHVQERAEAGTLTRAEDYTMQEFSDPVYVADYLEDLQRSWAAIL